MQACGGGGGDDPPAQPPAQPAPPPTVTAPSALSYTSPQTYTTGTAITAIMPTVTGTVTSYTVAPALPAGLSIDASTGAISGTPTQAAAAADYTVTATNAGGSTTFPLNITVSDPAAAPPSALSYASPQSYPVGTAITALTPTVTGTVTSYSVSPALPAGLAIDATTGAISGTPTTAAAEAPYTITATNAAGSTTFDLTLTVTAAAPERATTDRTPDEASGNQIHVLYVVPDQGTDRQFDMNGAIEGSVASWNKWFNTQVGKNLRLDTYGGGKLDVTFVQLQPTKDDATINAPGNARQRLEALLLAQGFDAVNKVYLAYYEGDGDGCGGADWPPNSPGTLAVVYLQGKANPADPTSADCPAAAFVAADADPGYWEYRALHETLHPLGFAPYCAPPAHLASGGPHVADDARDLLYSWTSIAQAPFYLDRLHDTYLNAQAAVPSCFDLSNSSFVDLGAPSGDEPPGHPYVNLTSSDADCAAESQVVIQPTTDPASITFVNDYAPGGVGTPLIVSQLVMGASGRARTNVNSLPYLSGLTLNTTTQAVATVGTVWVVSTNATDCKGIVTATANPSRFVIHGQ
ncbi:MAG TPA: Ig domain-containing protein [Gammaproteobacteria bacterium]|nr:Ig domain-containing protein [Gammaproteobacteria bacterium]